MDIVPAGQLRFAGLIISFTLFGPETIRIPSVFGSGCSFCDADRECADYQDGVFLSG